MRETLGKILIVEDDPIVAMDTVLSLEALGYSIEGPYYTLAEGLEHCEACECDAALLDVNLGGSDTSEEIAAVLRHRRIPFGFITAYSPDRVSFRQEDEPCLTKPMSHHVLEGMLQRLVANPIARSRP